MGGGVEGGYMCRNSFSGMNNHNTMYVHVYMLVNDL